MKRLVINHAISLSLILGLPGLAAAQAPSRCKDDILRGQYIFTASGFTRAPGSPPGTHWVPKAIVEILHFNGDGTHTTPSVILANPFGDTGAVLQVEPASSGTYSINEDCSGTVTFADGIQYKIHVAPPRGDEFWMIQINPTHNPNANNNVLQGSGKRLW